MIRFNIEIGQTKVARVDFDLPKDLSNPPMTPQWVARPDNAVTLAPAADGLSCEVTGGPVPTDFLLTATAPGSPHGNKPTAIATIEGHVVGDHAKGYITVEPLGGESIRVYPGNGVDQPDRMEA